MLPASICYYFFDLTSKKTLFATAYLKIFMFLFSVGKIIEISC
jgi:hypothetical protein